MADTGHTAGRGDQVSTPGGNGTVHAIEGEQVTGILHRNGMPFSYHLSRVAVVAKAPQQEERAAPSAGQFEGHTPGPWKLDPDYPTDVQTADGDKEICVVHPSTAFQTVTIAPAGTIPEMEEGRANATLIAAAPSLLARAEAAEERVRVLEGVLAEVVEDDNYAKRRDLRNTHCSHCGTRNNYVGVSQACRKRIDAALPTTGVQHG